MTTGNDHVRSSQTHSGLDKIERYKWQTKDKKGSFAYISKNVLRIDHIHYQRQKLSNIKILEMASNWSWVACGCLSVAKRDDGSLWIMDGQYRWEASMRRSDILDLPCLIFRVEEIRDEASGFLNVNTNRKAMKYIDRFKAQVTSGDEDAVFVKNLIQSSNRVAGEGSGSEIRCVGALMYWAKKDREALLRIWPTLNQLSPETPIPVQLVDGLMYLEMSISQWTISSPSVHQRLIQIGQTELLHAAREASYYHGKGGARIWAEGILKRYNKGLRNKLSINENECGE